MTSSIELIPSFKIGNPFREGGQEHDRHLLLEIGGRSVTLAVYNGEKQLLTGLEHYQLPESFEEIYRQLEDFLLTHEWIRKQYRAVWICFNTSDALLFPEELHDPSIQELVLNTVSGDLPDGDVINELVEKCGFYCVYRVPSSLYDLIGSRFGEESATHIYSVMARFNAANPVQDEMEVVIGAGRMTVQLTLDGKLQLMQSYPCGNGVEAAYFLLNIRQQFGLDAEAIPVVLSGMVEMDSALEQEISKYFRETRFAEKPSGVEHTEEFSQYPAHYFHTISKLALCVSSAVA